MRLSYIVQIACFIGAISFSVAALSAPPWMEDSADHNQKHKQKYKHHKKHHRHNDDEDGYRVVYERDRKGPPPWAPAHGRKEYAYRDKHRHESNSVIVEVPLDRETRNREAEGADSNFTVTSEKIGITSGTCHREAVGTVMGGIIGGIIGNKTSSRKDKSFGTLAGTLFGAIIGKQIGRNMDDADAKCSHQVLERARDGQAVSWDNPNSKTHYSMTPYKTFQRNDGRYCRQYRTNVQEGSMEKSFNETACRTNDGIWEKAQ